MTYAWSVELARADGRLAARAALAPDWGPASIWARFEGMRRGLVPPVLSSALGEVEPCWAEDGPPYVGALRVIIAAGGGPLREQIPVGYLTRQVADVARALVAAGRLVPGELVTPRIAAEPTVASSEDADGTAGFALAEIARPLALRETPLAAFRVRATPVDGADAARDVPVFVSSRVLAECEAFAAAAGDVETGGFLLGHLHRDPTVPEIFVEVRAQIPAKHVHAERARLTFTPATWAAMEDARRARGGHETLVGWWHYHPDFCAACPSEKRARCTLASTFFSAEDVTLHHLFGQAHQTALLVSAVDGRLERALFGWRAGSVARRGYHVTHS